MNLLNDCIKEIKEHTKEDEITIRRQLHTLRTKNEDKGNKYIDIYIKVFNANCEKYYHVGEHN